MVTDRKSGENLHSSLSKQFLDEATFDSSWRESKEEIALPMADIKSQEWYFEGIRVAYSDWSFHEIDKFDYQGEINNQVVTLYFNLRGTVKTSFNGQNGRETWELGSFQHNLFYSSASSGSLQGRKKRMTTFMIQFSLPAFLRLTQNANDVLKRFSENLMLGEPIALSSHNLSINGEMYQAINSLVNCKYHHGLKQMFFFSKTIELLVLQAEAFNAYQSGPAGFIKKDYDRDQIYYAREYLLEHLDNPPALSELSKLCGINEYKLKRGFKEIFGNTVFGFLSEKKLDIARDSLLEGTSSASEIAFSLGYSSIQHFSASFKKKFGVPPSQLKR
jgi:AraC family transcriptional regulator, transcriptional activator of the genes for pyochelin and ferripyochelin receptors